MPRARVDGSGVVIPPPLRALTLLPLPAGPMNPANAELVLWNVGVAMDFYVDES